MHHSGVPGGIRSTITFKSVTEYILELQSKYCIVRMLHTFPSGNLTGIFKTLKEEIFYWNFHFANGKFAKSQIRSLLYVYKSLNDS